MIKSLSHSVIALTLILGFAPIVKPISVSEANNNLYAQATTTDEEKLETANRLLQEGLALYKQGTKESLLQALAKFQEALPILREVNYPSGEGATLFRIGGVYYDLGKKQKALDYYNQTLPLFPAVENRQLEAATINNIGDVYDDLGEKQKALDYYNQSLPISQAVGDRQLEATTLNNIGLVYNNLGEKQKASYFSTVEDDYKFKTQILMQLHQQNPDRGYDVLAFETSEQGKARSLLELLEEANIDIRQGVAPELVTEEKRLQNKLDAIERQRISFCSQNCSQRLLNRLETERSKLVEQYKQVQAKIRANSPEYAELTQPQPIKLKQLQQLLDEDTVLWQYSLWRDRSYVWVISKDSFSTHELASREEIETLAREYHKLLQHESRDNKLNSVATKLSQFITPPTAEATQKSRIVIVSDAALQYIPFASLPTEDDRLLSNNHQIVNLPSSSVLARLRTNQENQIPATKKLAILADPVFSKSDIRLPQKQQPGTEDFGYDPLKSATRSLDLKLSRLKGTKKEAETIRDLVPESQKISAFGFDANLQFATSPELSNYNIVHFATHGILNSEKPELSGIVLSLFDEKGNPQNGFLRLHEVFNLDLPADLVVLSAYETGLGKEIRGEGLVGLTRGFMYAGATRLLVSLWKVNDAATAEFMSEFYSFILQDGLTPAEALNATQKYMQQHPDWNHPYYWAAFTLQGDWLSFDRTKR
ncbi:MAG: CHAT domain-containing protein [Xenococcaceae cyanobacterium]